MIDRTFFTSVLLLFLTGCQTKEIYVPVIEYKVLDVTHFEMCPVVAPPNKDIYKASSDRERIKLWTTSYMDQLSATKIRNQKMLNSLELNQSLIKK